MMNHQQWSSNRGYQQHLNVLTKIYKRGTSRPKSINVCPSQRNKPQCDSRPDSPRELLSLVRSKDNLAIRDQQILWDNYLLGKRIIETQPVICKRRLDEDYRKHRKLVHCLSNGPGRKRNTAQFRVKKMLEYKENVETIGQGRAIQTATHSNYLKLQIKNLTFYRQKPSLDQLVLIFTHFSKEGNPKKQKTTNFPANELYERHFYFAIPKRLMTSEQAVVIEIQNFKGLEQLSVGYFSFPSTQSEHCSAQIFHCGKPIGQIQLEGHVGHRSHPFQE